MNNASPPEAEKHKHLNVETNLTARLRPGIRRSPFSSWFYCQLKHEVIHHMGLSLHFLHLCLCFPSCNWSSAFQHTICGIFIKFFTEQTFLFILWTRKFLLLMSAEFFNYSTFLFTLVWYPYLRNTKLIKTNRTSEVERGLARKQASPFYVDRQAGARGVARNSTA